MIANLREGASSFSPASMIDALAPVALHETSVTERAEFRQCRRKWFLGTVKRLQPVGGAPYFWFGTLGHYALEAYYKAQQDGVQHPDVIAMQAYETFLRSSLAQTRKELGFLWEHGQQEYLDLAEMGRAILSGYFEMERDTGGFGEIVAVEERYRVPIRATSGKLFKGRPNLTGRFDLVAKRKDGTLWVIDHKFLGSKHNSSYLDVDDQLTGYAYVYWRATGILPRGQVYNVLLKKAPRPPRQLKNGVLSTAKDQATTYSLYLKEIKRLGLSRADYGEHLVWLKERGWQDFYIQEGVFRNMRQLEEFEANLAYEWQDMADVAAHPEKAYPSPSSFNCPGCPVKMICEAMQDQGDVEAIIDQQYTVGEVRR